MAERSIILLNQINRKRLQFNIESFYWSHKILGRCSGPSYDPGPGEWCSISQSEASIVFKWSLWTNQGRVMTQAPGEWCSISKLKRRPQHDIRGYEATDPRITIFQSNKANNDSSILLFSFVLKLIRLRSKVWASVTCNFTSHTILLLLLRRHWLKKWLLYFSLCNFSFDIHISVNRISFN